MRFNIPPASFAPPPSVKLPNTQSPRRWAGKPHEWLTRLDRYILQQLLVFLSALTLGSIALILLTQSLHFIPVVVQHGLSLGAFLHLAGLMLPAALLVILPVTTFLSILFVYQRLMHDRELNVLHATGLSPLILARPGLICGGASTVLCAILSLWAVPASSHAFHRYEYEIRNRLAAFLLDDGVFTPVSPTMTLYIAHRHSGNEFDGVMIEDARHPDHPVTILAEHGVMIPHNETIRLVLSNGSRQEIDRQTGQLTLLDFAQESIELGNHHTGSILGQDAAELPLSVLLHPPVGNLARFAHKYRIEAWHRFTAPWAALSYSLIALICILQGHFSRHQTFWRPFWAICCVIALITLSLILKSMAERHITAPFSWISLGWISLLWLETLLPALIGLILLLRDSFPPRQSLLTALSKGRRGHHHTSILGGSDRP